MQSTSTIVEGFRLSPQQRRLWKLQQDDPARSFGSQLVLSLEGELRIDALREALQRVCARHEALRTTFRRLPGVVMPVQSVVEGMRASWRTIDLSDLSGPAQTEEVEALLSLENSFDYENGPVVQATLVVLSSERHLLSINVSALCADRRTLSNLAAELGRCYSETSDDAEPFQYVQFSEWQNSLSEEEDAIKAQEYWSKQDLSTVFVTLSGPRARHVVRVHTRSEISGGFLLAAWQTLLWRRMEQAGVIGNVCDCRSYELLHDSFGLFARVLPVTSQITEGLRLEEVVEQIERCQREAEEWQDYFEWDQSAENAPGYFRFGFEYVDPITPFESAKNLKVSVVRRRCDFESFGLKLSCSASDGGVELEFEYNEASFDRAYVVHLAEQFQTLLEAAIAKPESRVEELVIVGAAERKQVLVEWNDTARDYELDECVHRLFERQVERTPDAVATVFNEQRVTFAELNRRADQVARYLEEQGVEAETPVGVCFEPSIEMVVCVLGVWKAGGAYVPLDPRNPQQRIEQVMSDAGIEILLTTKELLTGDLWKGDFTDEKKNQITADNLAYILYTSGSTGQPKGVMVQHRSVVNLAAALRDEVYGGVGFPLKVGLSAPLAFDASVKQLLQLVFGHTLFILPEELRLDAAHALAYFEQHELDAVDCTPSQLKLLLAAGLESRATRPKLMLVGGEAIDETTWSRLAEDPQTRFFNVYGPTECTVDATWTPITANTTPTIGRPIPNAEAYVLDKILEPTGIHLNGELFIGGAGLARGYLNSPDRTAERFIPDALSGKAGARLYRTGDLARYAPDGSIIFSGRNDAQVKIRGHRIELGEVETLLRQHDKVREAVVVAREGTNTDVRLVAYVVAADGNTIDVAELRRSLSERLPDYMTPSFIVAIDEFPLTRNGKVDLNALPAPEAARLTRDKHYVAPRNQIEAAITRVWQDVLGVDRIGVNDNFFDAGGHSLLMVQVHNKLSELFEKKISIVEMFAKPTISSLAEYFSETNGHKPTFEKVMDRAARRRQAASVRQ